MQIVEMFRAAYQRMRRDREKRAYTPQTFGNYLRLCGAQVGEDCWIAAKDMEVGIEPYLLKIGNRVTIERDVECLTHDGAAWIFRHLVPDLQMYGPIVIEDDCRIGCGAILCPNVRIGRGATIAAGAVVISDIPPRAAACGIPARATAPVPDAAFLEGLQVYVNTNNHTANR